MDLFKGIGNFLGGLFGNKKKREEQINTGQAQAPVVNTPKPVSAVEFNNPNHNKPRMLGDNVNKPLGVSVGGVVGGDKNPYETPKVQPAKPVAEVKPLTQPQKPATDNLLKGAERGGVLATFGDRRMSNGEHIYDWTNRFNKHVEDTVNREHQQWEKTRGSVDKIFNLNNFDRERSIANAKASFLADSRNTNYDNPQAVALAQKHAKAARQITDDVANNYKRTTGYGGFEGLFANSMADNAYSKMSRGIAKLNNDKSDAIHYAHLNNMLRTGQMTPEQAEQYRKNHNLSNVFGGDYLLDDKTGLYRERNFLEQKRKELEDVTGLAKDGVGLFTNSARAGIDVLTGENDKKNALGHAVNFVGNLPVGMVSGLAETPEMVVNAYGQIGDGIYHGDMGESLGGVAKLGESAINVVGLGTGGSGTLLKSLGLNIGKQTTKQGVKEVAKSGVKQVFKSLGKDIGGEALEEATQSLLGQLSEHNGDMSKVDWGQIGESAVMGGLGGGVMGGFGMGVEKYNSKSSYDPEELFRLENQPNRRPQLDDVNLENIYSQEKMEKLWKDRKNQIDINKIDPNQWGYNLDEIIGKINGDTRKRMSERSFRKLQELRGGNPYITDGGQEIHLTNKGNKKLVRTGQNIPDSLYNAKMRSIPEIERIINQSKYDHSSPDHKDHTVATGGFDYRETPVSINGEKYNIGLDIAKNNTTGINSLYNMNIKTSASDGFLRPSIQADANTYSVAQNKHKINPYGEDFKKIRREAGRYSEDFSQTNNPYTREYPDRLNGLKNRNSTVNKIVEDENGRYVKGEVNDDFNSNNISQLQKTAKKYNNNIYKNNIPIATLEGADVFVDRDSGGKWGYFNPEMKNNKKITLDKLKMTPLQGEMIEAAQFEYTQDGIPKITPNRNKIKHPDIEYWQYGTTRFESPDNNQQYTGVVNLGFNKDYQPVYYTIDKIKELPLHPLKDVGSSRKSTNYGGSPDISSVAQDGDNVKYKNNLSDRFGNTFTEENIPVSQLYRDKQFQPRTTASGKGTSDSVFNNGFNEGMVDQPFLVRKTDKGYQVLGGHSRTEGLERRAQAGLSNPETVRARVYENISDKQALQISHGANQGGQYESIQDMAKSISEARSQGLEPSVQKQNLVKGFTFDDYETLHNILSGDNLLQNRVFHGLLSQEDMLKIARTSRKLGFEPSHVRAVVQNAEARGGDFNRAQIEATLKRLKTMELNAENENSSLFDFDEALEVLPSGEDILKAERLAKKDKIMENSLKRISNNWDNLSDEQIAEISEMMRRRGIKSEDTISSVKTPENDPEDHITDIDEIVEPKPDQDIESYINQQLDAQAKDKKLSWKDRFDNFRAKFTHEMIDDAVAYEKYMDKSDKAEYSRQKAELRENIDRVRASDMIAKQFMEDNGLTKLGEMDAETMDNFQQYLIAKRHVEDLHGRDIKTGRDYEADKAIVEKFKDQFAEQEKTFRDFNHALLDYMADNGLISKKKANDLIKNNPNYAPFQRIMDDAEQFSGNSKQLGNLSSENVIKKMKGSERTVANPVESVMTNTLRAINEAERNKAAVGIAKGVFGEHQLKDGQKPRTGYDTISFFEKGQKVEYEVPVLVAQEMKNLNNATSESTKLIMKVAGAPVKALRSGATTANPIFTVSNLVRDQIQALFTGGVRSSLRGTPQALVSTFGVGKKAEALRAELARNGVIGNSYRQTYGFKHGDLIKELQNEYGNAHPVVKSARKMRHPIEALADVIGKTEEFTRAQQFFGTKGDVVTKSQAAKNNTLNFSRGGSTVRILNRIVPFLNAGVQGGRTTVNTFKNRPVHSTVATAIMGGVLMAVKGQNQEKDKEVWDRLTDAEKKTNIIIAGNDAKYNPETGRVEGVVKIPLPQHLYPLADAINNTKGKSEDFLRVAGDLFSSITGVDAENPVSQLTPTVAKPFVEAAVNKNFFTGREMVSEYDKNKAPEDKGAKYTSGLARNMAKMTGIDAPIIDNFIQSWTGGLGRDLTKSFTDNPDNKKDGGGFESYLGDGFGRRFLSGSAKSQYQIAEELASEKKKQVDAQNLSNEEKAKIKDKLDNDFKAIAKEKTKLERGEQGDGISERAGKLTNDGSLGDYIEDSLMTKAEKKRQEKKALYESNDAEYNKMYEDYMKNKDNYTELEKLQAGLKLKKAKVGKDFSKDVREAYGVNKQTLGLLLDTIQDPQKKEDLKNQILSYGDKLVEAGLEKKNKFRDKYGNVSFSSEKTGGNGRGRGRRGGGKAEPNYKAMSVSTLTGLDSNLMNLLKSTRNANTSVPRLQKLQLRDFSPKTIKRGAVRFNKR